MHIKHYEYKEIISNALHGYISKYSLCFDKENEYGIDLKNKFIRILISFRYQEFQLFFNNGKTQKELNDFIFKKFPNYVSLVKTNPEIAIFKKSNTRNVYEDFSYYLRQSFHFIQENFPEVFIGQL